MNMFKVFLIYFLLNTSIANAFAEDYFIISNQQLQQDQIQKTEIKKIFLGYKKFWKDKETIKVAQPNFKNSTSKYFIENVVGYDLANYKRYWRRKLFSGSGIPPKQFSTEKEIIEFVKSKPGAIGLVSEKPDDPTIKVLEVK